ncbi:MAG: ribbon-helix-helix domain-containing protein [Zavarzinia sp.]|nr:ribbon-helix-helix domain-containing protein [Zavarzinia sp.]
MTIQRKPKAVKTADEFVAGAPDAGAADTTPQPGGYEKGIKKGNKRQITLTIAPELLRRVDEAAKRTGQGRAAIINMAIFRALEGDIFKSH